MGHRPLHVSLVAAAVPWAEPNDALHYLSPLASVFYRVFFTSLGYAFAWPLESANTLPPFQSSPSTRLPRPRRPLELSQTTPFIISLWRLCFSEYFCVSGLRFLLWRWKDSTHFLLSMLSLRGEHCAPFHWQLFYRSTPCEMKSVKYKSQGLYCHACHFLFLLVKYYVFFSCLFLYISLIIYSAFRCVTDYTEANVI